MKTKLDLKNNRVTCEANHLTNFAVLMVGYCGLLLTTMVTNRVTTMVTTMVTVGYYHGY